MFRQVVRSIVASQVADLRRRCTGAVVTVAGILMVCAALSVAAIAFYLWLALKMPAWQAALIVAGVIFLMGLGLILTGRLLARRRVETDAKLEAQIKGLLDQTTGRSEKDTPFAVVAAAAIIGMVIGRRLNK